MKTTRRQLLQLGLVVLLLGLLLTPREALGQIKAEASRVRVLLVLDTDDTEGATWGLDGENVRALIEHMAQKQGLKDRMTIDHFTGDKVTAKSVLDYYNRLDTNEDEALMFYFSGHGGYDKTRGHIMAFTRGLLYRNDLLAAMDKKKPRLRIVLTDCCANYLDGGFPMPENPGRGTRRGPPGINHGLGRLDPSIIKPAQDRRPPVNGPNGPVDRRSEPPATESPLPAGTPFSPARNKAKNEEPPFTLTRGVDIRTATGKIAFETLLDKTDGKVLRDLLFRAVGLIDINGCKVGFVSMGTSEWGGSVFTNAFLVLMTEPPVKLGAKVANDPVSWEGFFPRWQKTTEQFARAYTAGQATQSPQAFQLGEKK